MPSHAPRVPEFRLEETTLEDGTRVVEVHGELDLAPAPALGQRIRRPMFWEGTTRVVVDLSGVVFLDSSGASALLLSLSHASALDRRLVFVCPPGDALRRLQMYGLDSRLEMFPTRAEAEAALAASGH
jgi:anti-sigma B factor antagonist